MPNAVGLSDLPCSPGELRCYFPYKIAALSHDDAMAEAASRLLMHVRINEEWSISWAEILREIEYRRWCQDRYIENCKTYEERQAKYVTMNFWYWFFCVITLGAYTFFVKRPQPAEWPQDESSDYSLFWREEMKKRYLSEQYVEKVKSGLAKLASHNLITQEGEMYRPTPKLVNASFTGTFE